LAGACIPPACIKPSTAIAIPNNRSLIRIAIPPDLLIAVMHCNLATMENAWLHGLD
jgi:hypothetical protein